MSAFITAGDFGTQNVPVGSYSAKLVGSNAEPFINTDSAKYPSKY